MQLLNSKKYRERDLVWGGLVESMDGRELEEAVLVPPKKADEIYRDVN